MQHPHQLFAGRYTLLKTLGSGAQGLAVRIADTLKDDRPLVLKLGLSGRESNDGVMSEFEALRGLTTRYIAPVVELGFAGPGELANIKQRYPSVATNTTGKPRPYLIRAWIDGPTILEWAIARLAKDSDRRVALHSISLVLAHLTEAVAELHRNGLIHSDLKPDHVLIVTNGDHHQPVLIDFGLAVANNIGPQGGTPAYMAPERLRGGAATEEADRFALGVVMAQTLLGARVELSNVDTEPNWAQLPARIRQTIVRLLGAEPSRRPSLESVRAALMPPSEAVQGWQAPAPSTLPFLGLERMAKLESLTTRALNTDASLSPVIFIVGESGIGKSRMLRQIGWSLQSLGRPTLDVVSASGQDPWSKLLHMGPRLASLGGVKYQTPDAESFVGDRAGWLQHLARSIEEVMPREPVAVLWDDIGEDPLEGFDAVEGLALILDHVGSKLRLWATVTPQQLGHLRTMFASSGFDVVHLSPLTQDDLGGLHGRSIAGRHLSYGELQRIHTQSEGHPGRIARVLTPNQDEASTPIDPSGPEAWLRVLVGLVPGGITQTALAAAATEVGYTHAILQKALKRCVAEGNVVAEAPRDASNSGQWTWIARTPAVTGLGDLLRLRLGRALAIFAAEYPHLAILSTALQRDKTALAEAWVVWGTTLHARQANALVMAVLEPALEAFAGDTTHSISEATMLDAYTEAALEAGQFERASLHIARCSQTATNIRKNVLDIAAAKLAFASGDLGEAEQRLAEMPVDPEALPLLAGYQATSLMTQIHLRRGRYHAAQESASVAALRLENAATSQARTLCAELWVTAAAAAAFLGDEDSQKALNSAKHALEQLHAKQQVPARVRARHHALKAVAAYMRGAIEEATEDYRAALEIVEQAGLAADRPLYLLNLGTAHERQVRLSMAREYYDQGARSCLPTTRPSTRALLLANRANIDIKLGRTAEARELLTAARRIAHEAAIDSVLRFVRYLEADADAADGNLGNAEPIYAELASQYHEGGDHRHACELALEAGLVAARSGRTSAARAYLQQAETRTEDFPNLRILVNILRAELEIARGGIERLGGIDRYLRALERAREDGDDFAVLTGARWLRRRLLASETRTDPLVQQELGSLSSRAWRRVALTLTPELRGDLARHLELDMTSPEPPPPSGSAITYVNSINTREPLHAAPYRTPSQPHVRAVHLSSATPLIQKFYRMISLNRRILGETDLERLIPAALHIALDLSNAERGFLLLRGETSAAFEVAFSQDVDGKPISDAHLEISQTVAVDVATSGQPIMTENASHDQRFERAVSVLHFQLTSIVCVPIRSRDHILGCLYLDHRSQPGVFNGDILDMLTAYADQVAIALVSARRVGELRRERDELARAQAQIQKLLGEKEALLMDLETRCENLEADLARERQVTGLRFNYDQIVAESPAMRKVLSQVDRVVATELPVVVQGESGTGKELISKALHFNGPRGEGPFVAINCGALTESLLESELFGHKKGAFTGATTDRKGLFEAANGGTLFLDEVGEMSLVMQVKLLRALQEQRIRPVGSMVEKQIDVRIVAATNRDLATMVRDGTFRQDLFYRLATLIIHLPPLRERPEDVPLLVRHILRISCERQGIEPPTVTGGAVQAMMAYTWPGNIRQLENIVRASLALGGGGIITADVVRPLIGVGGPASPGTYTAPRHPAQTLQAGRPPKCTPTQITHALELHQYNRSRAADHLGVSLRTLQRYIRKYQLIRR